jgi:GT2 family glycosyltransferase
VRKPVLDQVGLFDPRFFLYYEEVDHCRAVKAAGWQVMFYPDTTVVHIGGESAKVDAKISAAGRQIPALQIESGLLYFRKHYGRAGLLASVALTTLGDALLAAKQLLRRRSWSGVRSHWQHAATTWSLLRKTGWALRPTR